MTYSILQPQPARIGVGFPGTNGPGPDILWPVESGTSPR